MNMSEFTLLALRDPEAANQKLIKLALNILEREPKMFEQYLSGDFSDMAWWVKEYVRIAKEGNRVAAIKFLRECTSAGLKDAKYVGDVLFGCFNDTEAEKQAKYDSLPDDLKGTVVIIQQYLKRI